MTTSKNKSQSGNRRVYPGHEYLNNTFQIKSENGKTGIDEFSSQAQIAQNYF